MASSYKIELLNKDNFDTWKIQAKAILIKNKLWSYVEKQFDQAKADEQTKEFDRIAQSELVLLISPSELKQVKNCKSAHETWTKLHQIYESKGPARKATLLKQLILSKMQNGDIREHLNKFMDTVDKLMDMDINIHEDLLAVMMLYSLPSEYDNFRVAIETRDSLPKTEELKIKILEESEARNVYYTPKNEEQEESYFVKICKYCKKKGHTLKDCRTLKFKKKDTQVTQQQRKSYAACLSSKSYHTNNEEKKWILDSGCTSHMTNNKNYFDKLTKLNSQTLKLASKEATADIEGKGQIIFSMKPNNRGKTGEITLKDTLYVPTLCSNLMSVGKATDTGCTVIFTNKKAVVKHPQEGIIISAPKGKDGLYYINPASYKLRQDKCNLTDKENKIEKWHNYLGHMNEVDMKLALKNNVLIGLDFNINEKLGDCEVCIQSKIKRLPSENRTNSPRTTRQLEIVHSDVCGPMKVQTQYGNKYFVTFIDDFTRYSRVYCIKNKNEVLEKFKEYKAEMENYTGETIVSLQTDNGLEYCNKEFDIYLKNNGITRRLTAPYTPHQNGIAERKNRTLLEKARSMMLESKAPQHLWGEAINAANYLSNRSVNKTISAHFGTVTTPFEQWVKRKPCVSHLRQFGTKVFILLKDKKQNKFQSKAIPGMFVGYSDTSKAYRVWVPTKQNYYCQRCEIHKQALLH